MNNKIHIEIKEIIERTVGAEVTESYFDIHFTRNGLYINNIHLDREALIDLKAKLNAFTDI